MREKFIESIVKHQSAFGLSLTDEKIGGLADYYEFVRANNELLHLVAPISAEEFAVRHILESLTLLEYLPPETKFADVGTGAGLPSIPCLIAREDLTAVLIESKEKKTKFLGEAAKKTNVSDRASIVNKQFEEASSSGVSFVTCRAIDKFTQKLPRLLKWSGKANLLFFGGNNLAEALSEHKIVFERKLLPFSEQRYLFIIKTA